MNGLLARVSRRLLGSDRPNPSSNGAEVRIPERCVELALAHHQAGRIVEAQLLCNSALVVDPRHFDALHLLGVIAQQSGRSAEAIALIDDAIAVCPDSYLAHSNLGLAYLALGRLNEAEASLRRSVELNPAWDQSQNNLGNLLMVRGDGPGAATLFERALELNPVNVEALNNLGNICKDAGDHARAQQYYRKALELRPDVPEIWNNLGSVLQRTDVLAAAAECYQRALDLRPGDAGVYNNLGTVHQMRGQWAQAQQCFLLALKADSNFAEAYSNLAGVLQRLDRLDEAESCCRKALEIRPEFPDALDNLASILKAFSDLDGAESCCRKALAIDGAHVCSHVTLGTVFRAAGRLAEAEACYRDALQLDPHSATAKYNLSMLVLLGGNYHEGLELYESRFESFTKGFAARRDLESILEDKRRWRGGDLAGQRLLVWAEQGLGDTIMMLRYLPLLRTRGAGEIVVHCEAALERIVRAVSGVDRVVIRSDVDVPDGFDLHCPTMSLPQLFETKVDDIPGAVPYLSVPVDLEDRWKKRLAASTKTRVGLVWAGSATLQDDTKRSIPLAAFEPLLRIDGAQFFSLQKGEAADQLGAYRGRIEDWMGNCHDFMDTAALIQNLDLVICVDTAVAHLTGALGKPVWLLNRFGSEWRWGQQSERSAWYPTMRIFRQAEPVNWEPVIVRLERDLRNFLEILGGS